MTIKIGETFIGNQERDAIHIAVAPVVADIQLRPGERIGFIKDDGKTVSSVASKKIGIVDPFLRGMVYKGEKFYMFLFPNTVISLRHDWSHPDFIKADYDKGKSQEWITTWAAGYGMSYDRAMACAQNKDFFLWEVCYDKIPEEFWIHYENITGIKVDEDTRTETYFSCAC